MIFQSTSKRPWSLRLDLYKIISKTVWPPSSAELHLLFRAISSYSSKIKPGLHSVQADGKYWTPGSIYENFQKLWSILQNPSDQHTGESRVQNLTNIFITIFYVYKGLII